MISSSPIGSQPGMTPSTLHLQRKTWMIPWNDRWQVSGQGVTLRGQHHHSNGKTYDCIAFDPGANSDICDSTNITTTDQFMKAMHQFISAATSVNPSSNRRPKDHIDMRNEWLGHQTPSGSAMVFHASPNGHKFDFQFLPVSCSAIRRKPQTCRSRLKNINCLCVAAIPSFRTDTRIPASISGMLTRC